MVIYLRLHAPNAGDPGLTPTQGARFHRASLVAQTAQNLPAVQETQVQSLGYLRAGSLSHWTTTEVLNFDCLLPLCGNTSDFCLFAMILKRAGAWKAQDDSF